MTGFCYPMPYRAILAVALCWTVGSALLTACASEENIRKSKGYYQEGLAHLGTDQQQAYVSFQRAVKLNPGNKEAHYGLGHVYANQGKFKQAEEEFRVAIRIDPDYAEAHTYLGQVLANQEQWKDAIASFRRALNNPLYATPDLARFHLGRALLHEGDPQGAMEVLEDALTVNPPNVPQARLQLELGRVYHQLGFDVRAREALQKASALDKGGEYGTAATELLARIKP
ncbi:MAG TPA: tetratricopeptide repeat protein [Nitrospiraceae bacterium]|nr:tetratricopeptide repeat protein [Nitrospiraceae bacterium]